MGLLPAPSIDTPDVWVRLHGEGDDLEDRWAWRVLREDPAFTAWVALSAAEPAFRLRYGTAPRHIEFTIMGSGSRITTRCAGECTIDDVQALVLGPLLTCILRARGATCLHASVVAIDGAAVCLLGQAEAGKSTTAAGLLRLGARLLADDLAVLVEREGRFLVQPGSHRLRLRPDAAVALGKGDDLPRVWPDLPDRPQRHYLDVPNEPMVSRPSPSPLAALYILAASAESAARPLVETLSTARGLTLLLSNASASFMLPEVGSRPEFERLARLVRAVPVRKVCRLKRIDHLDAVCHAIRDDVMGIGLRSELVPT